MSKKFFVFLLAGVLMTSSAVFGASGSDTDLFSNSANQSDRKKLPVSDDGEAVKPPVEGKVNKEKIYELKRADNDRITIELWYREGSEYIAQISGVIYVPTGSTEYDGMLADNIAFEEKVEAAELSEDIMHFSYDEVKLSKGYVRCEFVFKELDGDNADSVEMIAEFLGLPTSNDYFKLNECEQYLQESGIPLDYEH